MTKCWVCGNESPESEQFCGSCGAKLESEGEAGPLQVAESPLEVAPSASEAGEGDSKEDGGEDAGSGGTEAEGAGSSDAGLTEAEAAPSEESKSGYLVFPDQSEKQISSSQWLIGRADLAKFCPEPEAANEISRGQMTVFQEGDKFFVEDGKTMVQEKPSANKTWLVRGGTRILVTGTGRNELKDADEIDVAELVKLQFVAK